MPTSPFRESRGATAGDQNSPPAASRGRRLGRNARRDIRWAMQQQPHDNVRQVELHGVKISYYRKGASEGQESSVSSRQAVPPSHTTPHDPSPDPPLNSRQGPAYPNTESPSYHVRGLGSRARVRSRLATLWLS